MKTPKNIDPKKIYQILYKTYGKQYWWPAETPFEVMIGAVLTQNTAWTNVEKAIQNIKVYIKKNHHTSKILAKHLYALSEAKLANLIKPSGFFNVKAKRLKHFCQWYVENKELKHLNKKTTAELREALLAIHGIGPETADDILLYAFDRPVFVIDAYTRRLFQRLGSIKGTEDYETLRAWLEDAFNLENKKNSKALIQIFNEYHALIVKHAKLACRKKPLCGQCPLNQVCPSSMA